MRRAGTVVSSAWMRLSLHSEAPANLLTDSGLNFRDFSECALKQKENWSDFDSAMRRCESSGASENFTSRASQSEAPRFLMIATRQLRSLAAVLFFLARFIGGLDPNLDPMGAIQAPTGHY